MIEYGNGSRVIASGEVMRLGDSWGWRGTTPAGEQFQGIAPSKAAAMDGVRRWGFAAIAASIAGTPAAAAMAPDDIALLRDGRTADYWRDHPVTP